MPGLGGEITLMVEKAGRPLILSLRKDEHENPSTDNMNSIDSTSAMTFSMKQIISTLANLKIFWNCVLSI